MNNRNVHSIEVPNSPSILASSRLPLDGCSTGFLRRSSDTLPGLLQILASTLQVLSHIPQVRLNLIGDTFRLNGLADDLADLDLSLTL